MQGHYIFYSNVTKVYHKKFSSYFVDKIVISRYNSNCKKIGIKKKIYIHMAKKVITIASFILFTCYGAAATVKNDTVALAPDTTEVESAFVDSAYLQSAEYDMLCLVAHLEGVKIRAYFDKYAQKWTIGVGNTIHPSGRKVRSYDRVQDQEELFDYFRVHVDKHIIPMMRKYLPLEKMSTQQIAAIGSLLYNTGAGILKNKATGEPSELSVAINNYFNDSIDAETNKAEIKRIMNNKVYSRGRKLTVLVKRRLLEEKIFFGEIIMDNHGEYALENSVNFAEQPIGAVYGISIADFADTSLICDSINNCKYGRNLADSIEHAFSAVKYAKR